MTVLPKAVSFFVEVKISTELFLKYWCKVSTLSRQKNEPKCNLLYFNKLCLGFLVGKDSSSTALFVYN